MRKRDLYAARRMALFFIGFFALLQCGLGLFLVLGQSPQAMRLYASLSPIPTGLEQVAVKMDKGDNHYETESMTTAYNTLFVPEPVPAP